MDQDKSIVAKKNGSSPKHDRIINILFLENNNLDEQLVQFTLVAGGIVFKITNAETLTEFEKKLQEERFDVMLVNYRISEASNLSALPLAKKHQRDVPFIFISDEVGNDLAVESLKR